MNLRPGFHQMFALALVVLSGAALCRAAGAEETATLKGKFIVNGAAPAPEKIVPDKDQAVCGKDMVKQEVVVGQGGELANVAVWLFTKDIKPADDKVPATAAVLDNHGCHFEPHVLIMRAGQPLEIKNSDSVGHNTMGLPGANPQFNVIIPAGGSQQIANLTKAERMPFKVNCSIHQWMGGWVVMKDNPYVAVSSKDGTFQIANLPVGKPLEFQAWQEKAGYLKNVTVDGKPAPWMLGRFKMTLKAGDNDLGTISVPADAFK